ncbi:hypothetical protein HanIR_Chr17g0867211 [Helianthus annuus]|nr:hypothetical protein HanIR_Chr17g0867211 [Helianthus annuus]
MNSSPSNHLCRTALCTFPESLGFSAKMRCKEVKKTAECSTRDGARTR